MTRTLFYFKCLIWFGMLTFALAACKDAGPTTTIPTAPTSPFTPISVKESTSTPTPLSPTATLIPLAARVNGTEITLADYQAELALYQAATGTDLATEEEVRVMADLIDQTLLAQAALENGFIADETLLLSRLKALSDQLGGQQALDDWMTTNGYTNESFQRALVRSINAAWMRDQIISSVPKNAEQVHVRQILLYNSEQANEVYAQLQAGNDFGNLANEYDPLTGGDLGWFPRSYLPDSRLEEIAFSLELEAYSPVIETLAGFHILQLIERDPQRPLNPEALLILQTLALQEWLEMRRSGSDIQILLS